MYNLSKKKNKQNRIKFMAAVAITSRYSMLVHPDLIWGGTTSMNRIRPGDTSCQDSHGIVDNITADTTPAQFDDLVGAAPNYSLIHGGRVGCHALGAAASIGNTALVRHIIRLSRGAMEPRGEAVEMIGILTVTDLGNYFGATPLHEAVMGGHIDVVRILLEEGANPNLKIRYTSGDSTYMEGRTPLNYAAKTQNIAIMRLLIQARAVVSQYSVTPEQRAVLIREQQFVEQAISQAVEAAGLLPELEEIVKQYY